MTTPYIEEKVDKVMEVLEKHTKLRQRDMETFKRWLTTSYSEVDRRARADWLRSEIEKLEGKLASAIARLCSLRESICAFRGNENFDYNEGYSNALTSIITRYKEELKVLESK